MTSKRADKWWLIVLPQAQQAFDELSTSEKAAVFRHLIRLVYADDPYQLPNVEMLQDPRFKRARKFRVGNHRVFFAARPGVTVQMGRNYNGVLLLLDIRNRKAAY